MHIKDPEYLKSQIVRSLYYNTDADPASLADYIIALLKHDKPLNELEAYCISQLQEFFHPGKAEPFIKDLLKYLNGDQQPSSTLLSSKDSKAEQPLITNMTNIGNSSSNQSSPRQSRRRRSLSRSVSPAREPRSSGISTRDMIEIWENEERVARDTITVDRIPQECCNKKALIEYFRRFGVVEYVKVNEKNRKAEIKFEYPEDARDAIACPDAVLGNRFVRIFWSYPLLSERRSRRIEPPRLTPSQSKMISETRKNEKQERLLALLQVQKQKQELLEKYVAQQKELLQKLENPNLGEQEKSVLKESILALDRSIQQVQELEVQVPGRPKSPTMIQPQVSAKTDPTKFKMDSRPGAFIMSPVPTLLRNDLESFKKILTSHGVLGNFRFDDATNSALIEYVNRQEASKVTNPNLIFVYRHLHR